MLSSSFSPSSSLYQLYRHTITGRLKLVLLWSTLIPGKRRMNAGRTSLRQWIHIEDPDLNLPNALTTTTTITIIKMRSRHRPPSKWVEIRTFCEHLFIVGNRRLDLMTTDTHTGGLLNCFLIVTNRYMASNFACGHSSFLRVIDFDRSFLE